MLTVYYTYHWHSSGCADTSPQDWSVTIELPFAQFEIAQCESLCCFCSSGLTIFHHRPTWMERKRMCCRANGLKNTMFSTLYQSQGTEFSEETQLLYHTKPIENISVAHFHGVSTPWEAFVCD